MAPLTGGKAKELLPLGSRSVLARILAEAREAGADRIVVVNSREKPEIDAAVEGMADVRVAYQSRMRGVADAIAAADVREDALIMMGDAVFQGGSPSARLRQALVGADGAIAVETVDDAHVSLYGIVVGSPRVERILEKPAPDETPSRAAVAARYSLNARMMEFLHLRVRELGSQGSEITLTQILMDAIRDGAEFVPIALAAGERRVDCGSPEEYAEAVRIPWE